jgi:ribonucleotide reductase beta subunit family protein with ferritin-like domain
MNTTQSKEILLQPDRLHLLPIKYKDIWDMYKQAESSFWTVEEVDLTNDKKEFDENLSENEKHFISHILAFFATADGLVFDNIDANFGEEVQIREAKSFYSFQKFIEGIHNEMYSVMIESLIADTKKRDEIFRSVHSFPGIKKKAEWALQYMDRRNASFAIRLVAFIIMEYIFFSASFAAIFWFRKRGKMHGLCFSNELIARDEALHAKFGCLLFTNYLVDKPSQSIVHQMVKEAVAIESEFVKESLPVRLIGMNSDAMIQYVQYIADHMLSSLNLSKLYNQENPFEWMELISLQGKTNFFEKRVSEYSVANVGATEDEKKFDLNADF